MCIRDSLKSVTVEVDGENAYGFLRSEKGVHRLVLISPFDSNARRQTSFSSLDVSPIIDDDDNEVEIDMKDVRVDTSVSYTHLDVYKRQR